MAGTTSPDIITVRRRFIAAKYKADQRDKRSPKPPFSRSSHRVRELERLFTARYGLYLPDDDAGRDDLELAFNQIAAIDACIKWAAKWAPWMASDVAAALAGQICAAPQWLKADALGELLRLTDLERTRLKIKTIRPIEALTDEALTEVRKRKDRERKKLERQIDRASKPAPASQTKPWEAEGISRRTWCRRKAEAGCSGRGTKPVRNNPLSITQDTICATTPPARAVGTTAQESIRVAMVDRVAGVGNPNRQSRPLKIRFPTSLRLTKEMRSRGLASGFEPAQIALMFEIFRDWNIAKRCYSTDWDEVWSNWVDREAEIVNERYDRDRRRAYYERRWAA